MKKHMLRDTESWCIILREWPTRRGGTYARASAF